MFFLPGGGIRISQSGLIQQKGRLLFWGAGQNSLLATEELFFKVVGDSSMPRMRFHVWSPWKPPRFNSSPLKNGGWKTALLSYWEGSFSGLCETLGGYYLHVFQPSFQWFRVQNNKNINALLAKVDDSLICEISVVSNHWFVYKCKMGLDSLTLFAALHPNDRSYDLPVMGILPATPNLRSLIDSYTSFGPY